ncbi:MAG: hypothetical protein EPO32_13540 [Anaerolineae bacterium]|nr:MAG: hypothetical protein EPO32_13540 [Anaerolineae bacterium]
MNAPRNPTLRGTLALFWLSLAVILYYLTHRPFLPPATTGVASAVQSVVLCGLVLLVGGGLGRRIAPGMNLPGAAAAAVQAALGLGLWGLAVLGLGVSLGFNSTIAWLLLLVALVLLRREIWAWARDVWNGAQGVIGTGGRTGRAIALLVGIIVVFGLLAALAPPLRFDALVYHLTLPAEYLAAGRVSHLPYNAFSGFPQNLHMLYLWSMALGAARPAVLGWCLGAVAALGLWALVADRFSPRAAWVALAALLVGYSPAASLGWAYVDWAGILFGLALWLALLNWQENLSRRNLVLAGLVAGLMLGVKFTSGALFIPAALWLALQKPCRAAVVGALVFGLAAAAAVAPWLLKNYAFTGNPVFPLAIPGLPSGLSEIRAGVLQGGPVRGGWTDLLLLPIRATYWGVELGQVGDAPGYEASIGALFLGLGALAALNPAGLDDRARRARALAAWLGVGGVVVFAIAGRVADHLSHTHLYYALFAPLAALAAIGYYQLAHIPMPGVRMGRIAAVLVLLALSTNALEISVESLKRNTPGAGLGLVTEQRYLEDTLGLFALVNQEINALPPGSRVLMLWEGRTYYCRPVCFPDDLLARWPDDLRRLGSADAVLAGWRDEGFTHLLVFHGAADFLRANDPRYPQDEWRAHDALLKTLPVVVDLNGFYILYDLRAP